MIINNNPYNTQVRFGMSLMSAGRDIVAARNELNRLLQAKVVDPAKIAAARARLQTAEKAATQATGENQGKIANLLTPKT